MLYILNQQRDMSIPIKDDYIVYIRTHENMEIYEIITDANPESSGVDKREYFLGRYFDEKFAIEVMKYINKLRSVGDAHYVMPENHPVCDNPDYCDI